MITTVLGNIDKSKLGITSSHEHILIDMRNCVDETIYKDKKLFYSKLTQKNRYQVFSDPYTIIDNALIDNKDIALKELKFFKQAGGESIVDATLDEIGRNPSVLKELSQKSGLNIVMGCGHYYDTAHPNWVKEATEKELYEEIKKDLTLGVKNTKIKAGVIGEIGTSKVITDSEIKVLKAAAIASYELDKAIHIHTSLFEENGYEVIKILKSKKVKKNRICINHIDVKLREDYIFNLLDEGVYIEFDNFGKEFYVSKNKSGSMSERFVYDLERAKIISNIAKKGYINQVLLSNDICLKSMLCAYGGNGYAHILNNIKYMLLDEGLTKKQISTIYIDNIANFLD